MSLDPSADIPPKGYKSAEGRRTYLMLTGFIVLITTGLILLLPREIARQLPPVPEVRSAVQYQAPIGATVVRWKGGIWYVAVEPSGGGEGCDTRPKNLLVRLGPQGPKSAFTLSPGQTWLVPQDDKLWIVSPDGLSRYDGEKMEPAPAAKLEGAASRPFILDGRLTVLVEKDKAVTAQALEGAEWKEVARLGAMGERACVTVVNGAPVVLCEKDGKAYAHRGFPDEKTPFPADWQVVGPVGPEWMAGEVGGRPSLLTAVKGDRSPASTITLYTLGADGWTGRKVQELDYPLMALGLAAPAETALVLYQVAPWAVTVVEITGAGQKAERYGGLLPARPDQLFWLFLPSLVVTATVLAAGLVISLLMETYRDDTYADAGVPVPYASLAARIAAFAIDMIIVFVPCLGLWGAAWLEDQSANVRYRLIELVGMAAVGWFLLALLAYTFATGRWGRTPGKWAMGLRVVGLDLRPCGFARALLRALLLMADRILEFLFGVVLIAITTHRQRLGDLVARTVVIRDRRLPVHLPDRSEATEAQT